MLAGLEREGRRIAERRAARRRAELAARLAAELPADIEAGAAETADGIALAGRGLRRRLALDPELRSLIGRVA